MKKAQVVKFWRAIESSTNQKKTIAQFEHKPEYTGRRTLERYAQAYTGFNQGTSTVEIARKTDWSEQFVNRIRKWWADEFSNPEHLDREISTLEKMHDPITLEARRKHLDEITNLLKLWIMAGYAQRLRAYEEIHSAEKEPLLPFLLQHCPSIIDQFQVFKNKREQYKIAEEIEINKLSKSTPPGASEFYNRLAVRYAIRCTFGGEFPTYGKMHEYAKPFKLGAPSVYSIILGDVDLIQYTIAKGDIDSTNNLHENHKQLILRLKDNMPDLQDAVKDLLNSRDILCKALNEIIFRQSYIMTRCDVCRDW